jgi:hypothetical protein
MPFERHFRYYCIANVAKRLPGTVWYVAGRGYLYGGDGVNARAVVTASGIELAVMLLSGVATAAIFVLPRTAASGLQLVALGTIGSLTLTAIHPRVLRRLLRALRVTPERMPGYRSLLGWLASYMLVWSLSGLVLYLIGSAIWPIEPRHIPYVIGSVALAGVMSSSLFLLPSNFGVNELSLSLLLNAILPLSLAGLIALASRVLVLLYDILWAGAGWTLGRNRSERNSSNVRH